MVATGWSKNIHKYCTVNTVQSTMYRSLWHDIHGLYIGNKTYVPIKLLSGDSNPSCKIYWMFRCFRPDPHTLRTDVIMMWFLYCICRRRARGWYSGAHQMQFAIMPHLAGCEHLSGRINQLFLYLVFGRIPKWQSGFLVLYLNSGNPAKYRHAAIGVNKQRADTFVTVYRYWKRQMSRCFLSLLQRTKHEFLKGVKNTRSTR